MTSRSHARVHMLAGVNLESGVVHSVPLGEVFMFTRGRASGEGHNEDGALVMVCDDEAVVLAVADGMGGLPCGEEAAKVALDAIVVSMSDTNAGTHERVLSGMDRANQAVMELNKGAGTTLCVAIVSDGVVRIFHAGDSGAMVVGQRGRLKQSTIAHSPTGFALEAGLMEEEEALVHEDRHLISNMVGDEAMKIEVGPEQKVARFDRLLLATDGLLDNLTLGEIVEAIRAGPLDAAGRLLVERAMNRMANCSADALGKEDDLTFLLFRSSAKHRDRQPARS